MKKKLLLLIISFLAFNFVNAQQDEKKDSLEFKKNAVKVNLLSIPLKNYNFSYERGITKKSSINLGVRFAPKSTIPFLSSVKNLIDDEEINKHLDGLEISNFAITPEYRFYFGKKPLSGFYIAPFARYAKYSAEGPFDFEVDILGTTRTETIPLKADIDTYTAGIQLGAKWNLSKRLLLDFSFFGPQYGTSKGNINGVKTLTNDEVDALKTEFADFVADLPDQIDVEYEVTNNGIKAKAEGPWAGLRFGLSLGYKF